MTGIYLLLALVANAVANILMKLGAPQFADGLKKLNTDPMVFFGNWHFFVGLICFGTALLFYNLVLSKMQLSVAYPIMTTMGFVIVVSYSIYALDETLLWWQWLGLGMVLVGVVLLSQ